ncbi:MAG: hypothetical protein WDW36_005501 [Sanguina aurantia]
MKLETLADKTSEEITSIWEEHHATLPHRVCTVLTSQEYATLQERAKSSPLFVLPMPKPGGFFTFLWQVQLPYVFVTSVDEYRKHTGGAPAHLSVTLYTELLASKDVVLVRADIVNDQTVSVPEANTMVQLLRAFYTDDKDHEMVHAFNHNQDAFSFEALMQKLGQKVPAQI